jgi:hypothetical protein
MTKKFLADDEEPFARTDGPRPSAELAGIVSATGAAIDPHEVMVLKAIEDHEREIAHLIAVLMSEEQKAHKALERTIARIMRTKF